MCNSIGRCIYIIDSKSSLNVVLTKAKSFVWTTLPFRLLEIHDLLYFIFSFIIYIILFCT